MKRIYTLTAAGLLLASSADAAVIGLQDYGFNVDGTITHTGEASPAGVDTSAFDFGTGLGTIDVTVDGAGSHNVLAWFDHEIDAFPNTWFNEYGAASGSPASGQSWEIDEPGFVFGDIFGNWQSNALDGSNNVPSTLPDDVSMALGFDFGLSAAQTALVSFTVDPMRPEAAPGIVLEHADPDSEANIFYWADLEIRGDSEPPAPVPAPGTFLLMLAGLGMLPLARYSSGRAATGVTR